MCLVQTSSRFQTSTPQWQKRASSTFAQHNEGGKSFWAHTKPFSLAKVVFPTDALIFIRYWQEIDFESFWIWKKVGNPNYSDWQHFFLTNSSSQLTTMTVMDYSDVQNSDVNLSWNLIFTNNGYGTIPWPPCHSTAFFINQEATLWRSILKDARPIRSSYGVVDKLVT